MESINVKDLKRTRIICVSGPVGAGKSTFSRTLRQYLISEGHKVCVVRFSAFPLFSYFFFRMVAVLLYGPRIVKMHERVNVHPSTLVVLRIKKIPTPILLIIEVLEILSVFLSFYVRILLRCISEDIIIVDEGVINIFANYIEVFGENSVSLILYVTMLLKKLQGKFDLDIVFLDVKDYSILLRRWYTRKYPLPTSLVSTRHHLRYLEFIECSRNIVAKIFRWIIKIDAAEKSPYRLINEYIAFRSSILGNNDTV